LTPAAAVRGARLRLADAGWSVVQTPVAAGLAWYIAHTLLGHHQPFFAPTAAAVSLSKTRVLRGQRALQLITGVVLGIGAGTAVRAVAGSTPGGSGAIVIGVAALIAFILAQLLGGGFFEHGVLFVNQSTTSAILMIAVAGAATATERLTDALIGGGVTLVITVLLFPVAPLPLIQGAIRRAFAVLRDTLASLAETGTATSPEWVLAAGQRVHGQLAAVQEACSTARQVAWLSPRRWPERSRVRQAAEQSTQLHLLAATVLSLAHASSTRTAGQQPEPAAVRQSLGELTAAFAALAAAAATEAAVHADHARGLTTAARASSPHSALIASLVQTCADDILRLTGAVQALNLRS
jgi:uncharacterized membrane protein YgaE (UPF0421/DUF939 family)